MSNTSRRGFASMDVERQRQIASKGGKAAHQRGTAHEFTTEEARLAGRKGGERRSQNAQRLQTASGIMNTREVVEPSTNNFLNGPNVANGLGNTHNGNPLNSNLRNGNSRDESTLRTGGNMVESSNYVRNGQNGNL